MINFKFGNKATSGLGLKAYQKVAIDNSASGVNLAIVRAPTFPCIWRPKAIKAGPVHMALLILFDPNIPLIKSVYLPFPL